MLVILSTPSTAYVSCSLKTILSKKESEEKALMLRSEIEKLENENQQLR